jgi:hypothetical protein
MELECECEAVYSVAMHATSCGVVSGSACPKHSCVQPAVSFLPVSEFKHNLRYGIGNAH